MFGCTPLGGHPTGTVVRWIRAILQFLGANSFISKSIIVPSKIVLSMRLDSSISTELEL